MNDIPFKPELFLRFVIFGAIVAAAMMAFPDPQLVDQSETSISERIESILSSINQMIIPILAVGVITSAIVEALKDLLKLRKFFHYWLVRRWLKENLSAESYPGNSDTPTSWHTVVEYGAGGNESQFIAASTENLVSTLSEVAQVALHNIHDDSLANLVANLAYPTGKADVKKLRGEAGTKVTSAELKAARERVSLLIQRRLKALATHIENVWGGWLKIISFFVSAFIIILTYRGMFEGIQLLVIAILGAIIAPVVRDLVAAIKRAREGLS